MFRHSTCIFMLLFQRLPLAKENCKWLSNQRFVSISHPCLPLSCFDYCLTAVLSLSWSFTDCLLLDWVACWWKEKSSSWRQTRTNGDECKMSLRQWHFLEQWCGCFCAFVSLFELAISVCHSAPHTHICEAPSRWDGNVSDLKPSGTIT